MTIIIIIASVLVLFFYYLVKNTKHLPGSFTQNSDGSFTRSVSFDYVMSFEYGEMYSNYLKGLECYNCGAKAAQLKWFEYQTSGFRQLAGASGFYAKCPQCDIEVHKFAPFIS